LILDQNALDNLEILTSRQDGSRENTLIGTMDRTITAMGARRLREVLVSPLRAAKKVNARLELVAELVDESMIRDSLRSMLKGLADIERILSRVSAGTAPPRDLAALGGTISQLPPVGELLSDLDSVMGRSVHERLDMLEELGILLAAAMADGPAATLKDGGVIREGYDRELDELRSMASDGRKFISELESREKKETKIPSLKVGFNKVFGYYLEVTNTHKELVPESYIRKQTLVNAERYITEELKEMEEKILGAQERMAARERAIFESLCREVLRYSERIQETAGALADTDLFSSFAELAHTSGYCRPQILDDDPEKRVSITAGRHPVLEVSGVTESFVPNDTFLDRDMNRMMILTGPNMAGKSTYMRQVALIVIMAQAGSFVPATEAVFSPVDRVFTRVGASDALARGLSTFMVEMVETAEILNNATEDSLVVLDEIGRGTSTFDGVSIAWAVAEFLLSGPPRGCRTMFATHYHELTELALTREGVFNSNVAIREWGDKLVFLHRIQEGPADKSYGIQVGKLAGLPAEVVKRAAKILTNLEEHALDSEGQPVLVATEREGDGAALENDGQMGLFPGGEETINRLLDADLENMTPIEALNLLADLKRRYE
jgi:DNA mismatch repair protein MutS